MFVSSTVFYELIAIYCARELLTGLLAAAVRAVQQIIRAKEDGDRSHVRAAPAKPFKAASKPLR
jgi:hypothetical protein